MKTTAKDFKLFKQECQKWIEYFGLINWRISYFGEQLDVDYAVCSWDIEGRCASITFSKYISEDVEFPNIKKCAFHEVCELFLADLQSLANTRYTTSIEINIATQGY